MKLTAFQWLGIFAIIGIMIVPNNVFAQNEKEVRKKIVIVKETIDEDGNKVVEKIIKEGDEVSEVEEYVNIHRMEGEEIEVEVEMIEEHEDGKENMRQEKHVSVTVNGDEVKINDGNEERVVNISEGESKREIKTDDGKRIIIVTKEGESGEDVEKILEDLDINTENLSDGKSETRIKIKRTMRKGNGAFFGVMMNPTEEGVTLSNVIKDSPAEKAGLKKGDILKGMGATTINSNEDVTNELAKHQPGDNVVVLFEREGSVGKVLVQLGDTQDMEMDEKMIWKTEDGEEIEIKGDKEIHSVEEHKKEVKKKIVKKKTTKEKE